MRHTGSLFPLLLVGILAAVTFWLQSVMGPGDRRADGRQRHDPDFIVENFTVRRFNIEGQLQHTLRAKRMEHFADDDTTLVQAPHIIFHGDMPSTLVADRALLTKDAKQVTLENNVRMERAAVRDRAATVIESSRLVVLPDEEVASTDQPVVITQGRSVVHGSGLMADNKIQTSSLQGPVRGTIYRTPGK